ncbi:hypothetical protein E2C01_016369 [Portunus trituberculatus]|uniref:Uncharacterized protein n=1 Tax=Portunus trituberculatus TaxID=210409 RepID=A0A5B7DQ34_PORTR|nr:hypothetical protein [Portunus trituberculatus]
MLEGLREREGEGEGMRAKGQRGMEGLIKSSRLQGCGSGLGQAGQAGQAKREGDSDITALCLLDLHGWKCRVALVICSVSQMVRVPCRLVLT